MPYFRFDSYVNSIYTNGVHYAKNATWISVLKIALAIAGIVSGVYIIYIFGYIFNEFVFQNHILNKPCLHCANISPSDVVPKSIHQIYYSQDGSGVIPDNLLEAQASCRSQNSDYVYTLWNESMVLNFIDANYPQLKVLFLTIYLPFYIVSNNDNNLKALFKHSGLNYMIKLLT